MLDKCDTFEFSRAVHCFNECMGHFVRMKCFCSGGYLMTSIETALNGFN
jgi:hypothetical protein